MWHRGPSDTPLPLSLLTAQRQRSRLPRRPVCRVLWVLPVSNSAVHTNRFRYSHERCFSLASCPSPTPCVSPSRITQIPGPVCPGDRPRSRPRQPGRKLSRNTRLHKLLSCITVVWLCRRDMCECMCVAERCVCVQPTHRDLAPPRPANEGGSRRGCRWTRRWLLQAGGRPIDTHMQLTWRGNAHRRSLRQRRGETRETRETFQ